MYHREAEEKEKKKKKKGNFLLQFKNGPKRTRVEWSREKLKGKFTEWVEGTIFNEQWPCPEFRVLCRLLPQEFSRFFLFKCFCLGSQLATS